VGFASIVQNQNDQRKYNSIIDQYAHIEIQTKMLALCVFFRRDEFPTMIESNKNHWLYFTLFSLTKPFEGSVVSHILGKDYIETKLKDLKCT